MMSGHDAATPLPDPVPAPRLARTARLRTDIQERRAARAATRGRRAAPTGPKTASYLAGSGDPRGVDTAPLKGASTPSPRHPRHAAALASGPPQAPWDQAPPPTWPTVEVA